MTKKQMALPQESVQPTNPSPSDSPMPPHRPYPESSPIGTLHKTYKRMRSDTLHTTFRQNPQLWREYHAERKRNFASYDPSSIPCNRIIAELAKIRTSRRKLVVDMGCGDASIAHHFSAQSDHRFQFANYDHQSGGDPTITEVDMSKLPLGDASAEIAIMSLALWGTSDNCRQYVQEAHRVLESGGLFYIIDTTKRWSPEPLTTDKNAGELLQTLLTSCGFRIVSEDVGVPFCMFVCNKNY
jgi:SAM-dependent methyltransferase